MLRPLLTALLFVMTSPAAATSAEAVAATIRDNIAKAQQTTEALLQQQRAAKLAQELLNTTPAVKSPTGIADPEMAAEWEAVRKGLGIENDTQFYIFVSFSMPESLIRAYALDAARAGGTLVLRGIEEGSDLRSFFMDRLSLIVRPGLAATPIQIDPRLFDAYNIEHVPTLVLAKKIEGGLDELCLDVQVEHVVTGEGIAVPHQRCPARDQGSYWKVAGSVTSLYALEQFAENGASAAQPFMDALKNAGAASKAEQTELSADEWGELADALMQRNDSLLHTR